MATLDPKIRSLCPIETIRTQSAASFFDQKNDVALCVRIVSIGQRLRILGFKVAIFMDKI